MFFSCKTGAFAPELQVSVGPKPHLWFLNAKPRLLDQKTSLYGSQTWPVVFCKQYSVISIRNASLYRFQTSSVIFACKTAWLSSELLVSIVPRPHLWILIAKQRLLDQHTSLYGYQTSPVVLCMQNSLISIRITSLYGFQPSSVVLCIQNSDLRTKIARLCGPQTSHVNFCMQNSMPSIRIISLYGSQPSSVLFACKTAPFGPV